MTRLANPTRFMRLADRLLPWLAAATVLAFAAGLVWGLGFAPPDYQQGDTVRIMFVHVPAAWLAMFGYSFMAVASFVALVWKHPLADVAAKAAAPLGAGFCLIALITGSLWGEPMWGTWWVWDARLTSMLVLFFLYVGYIALWSAIDEPERAARAAAILALVGAVNVPIVKFSVDWWSTLHQPASVIRMDGPTIDASILWPLAINALAFQLYFVTVLLWRMKAELIGRRIRALTLGIAAREA
ncbi:heme ABC transporter permease [Zavarzinia compransoris]|uniref:heme ABC transporter permease n=1 Tax=Zavarzinia marina TaxID=2911065 RepID=UPI001F2628A3|nr:heme ABC transporter permease [Zavarzinia marina]MCF4165914.1 heme ABC transporter permease [Zavarzinia marina]